MRKTCYLPFFFLDKKETKNQVCTETILNFGAKSLRIHLAASLKLRFKVSFYDFSPRNSRVSLRAI
jgi:hypothetical protein